MTITKRISFSIPTARERLAALGLTEEEIERALALVEEKYGPVDRLIPGEYTIELPVEKAEAVYTNQEIISAIYAAAREVGEDGWAWLRRAGLTSLVADRGAEYRGPAIDDLPGLTAEEKARVKAALAPIPISPVEVPEFTWVGPTDNRYRGRFGHKIEMIVIHYTASGSGRGTVAWFKNPQSKVSAHYVVDRDGRIFQVVKDEDTAWHAGLASRPALGPEANRLRMERDDLVRPNQRSIGIEIVNWGPLERRGGKYYTWLGREHTGEVVEVAGRHWEPYTEAQYESLIELVSYLCKRYGIPAQFPPQGPGVYHPRAEDLADFKGILGHSAIDNTKTDPGPHFDWDRLLDGVRARSTD